MNQAAGIRLRTQRLTSAPLRTPADATAWLGAVQSQEYGVAKWSVGLRSPAYKLSFMHVVVLDGHVIGHWRPAAKKTRGAVDLKLARPLERSDRDEVEAAVARYRTFAST